MAAAVAVAAAAAVDTESKDKLPGERQTLDASFRPDAHESSTETNCAHGPDVGKGSRKLRWEGKSSSPQTARGGPSYYPVETR